MWAFRTQPKAIPMSAYRSKELQNPRLGNGVGESTHLPNMCTGHRFPDSTPYVGWVCWFSTLLWDMESHNFLMQSLFLWSWRIVLMFLSFVIVYCSNITMWCSFVIMWRDLLVTCYVSIMTCWGLLLTSCVYNHIRGEIRCHKEPHHIKCKHSTSNEDLNTS